jgi:hypothetical protein
MEGTLLARHEQLLRRTGATSSNYDVTADGKRFLMITDDDMDRARSRQMIVVQGWADEVRRLSASS